MIIDCDTCEVRGSACGDCVIGVLLGAPEPRATSGPPGRHADGVPPGASIVQLDAPEQRALDVLADQGLIPRLRLVAPPLRRVTPGTAESDEVRYTG